MSTEQANICQLMNKSIGQIDHKKTSGNKKPEAIIKCMDIIN